MAAAIAKLRGGVVPVSVWLSHHSKSTETPFVKFEMAPIGDESRDQA